MTDIYTPAFFAEHHMTTTLSAGVIAPLVKQMWEPQSLLDVGCGQGEWIEAFALEDFVGVDIAAPERDGFLRHDLTTPLDLGRNFDLVMSLETAEHLPEEASDIYVQTIAGHASELVLFSAAIPGQEGLHHVNCQPHEYWHEKFASHGFWVVDAIRPHIERNTLVSWWYRQNVFVYCR